MNFRQRPYWVHGFGLAGLALLLAGVSLLIWFHPTLGFARGGILNGADLRASLIQICAWLFLSFAAVSTLTIMALARIRRPLLTCALAYALGILAAGFIFRILDRLY